MTTNKTTEQQKKQLEWVDKWEYVYINSYRQHHVTCKDCKINSFFYAPGSVRDFINNHIGHNTTYFARKD